MTRILVADDHSIVRKGIIQILREDMPLAEIEEVNNADELIHNALGKTWDLVICDITMPGRSGLDSLHQIKQSKPDLPFLVVSMHPEEQYAIRVLKAGASGYLNKETASAELMKAVNKILSGKKYITEKVAEAMATNLNRDEKQLPHQTLSDREFEVMRLIATGKSVSQIAEILSLSTTTVSTYRARVLAKMQISNNAALTLYAIENNLA
jgi:two-component system invasion response regulator UvrY